MQIVVLGMHRSGTSMVTRLTNMMGAYFGPEGVSTGRNQENPKGFWERRDIRNINDAMLSACGCEWDRPIGFSRERIDARARDELDKRVRQQVLDLDAHRPWVAKEPRFCLTLPMWAPALEVPVVIHVIRDPLEIARSLQRRNGIPVPVGLALWEFYVLAGARGASGLKSVTVFHRKLIQEPERAVTELFRGLSALGVSGLRLPAAEEITAFVDPALHRATATEQDSGAFMLRTHAEVWALQKAGDYTALAKRECSQASLEALEGYSELSRRNDDIKASLNAVRKELAAKSDVSLVKAKESGEWGAFVTSIEKLTLQIGNQETRLDSLTQSISEVQVEWRQIAKVVGSLISPQPREADRDDTVAGSAPLESLTAAHGCREDGVSEGKRVAGNLEMAGPGGTQSKKGGDNGGDGDTRSMSDELDRLKYQIAQSEKRIHALAGERGHIRELVNQSLTSWRWRVGDRLVRLAEIALRRPRPHLTADTLRALLDNDVAPIERATAPEPRLESSVPVAPVAVDRIPVHVLVYSRQPGQLLGLTLRGLAGLTEGKARFVHLILDWAADTPDLPIAFDGSVANHRFYDGRGYYAAVKAVMDRVGSAHFVVLREGVVLPAGAVERLLATLLSSGRYAAVSPLTNRLSGHPCPMRPGMNVSSTNAAYALLNEPGRAIDAPMLDVDAFAVDRSALRKVPFPGFVEDRTCQSLVRFFQAVRGCGMTIGIALDCYAYSYADPGEDAVALWKLVRPESQFELSRDIQRFSQSMKTLAIDDSVANAVIVAKHTVCVLLSSLLLRGGVIVLVNWINELVLRGVDVRVYVQNINSGVGEGLRLLFTPKPFATAACVAKDLPVGTDIVATFWTTAGAAAEIVSLVPKSRGYYFIQDFEVDFYDDSAAERDYKEGARASYALGLEMIVTSEWVANKLRENGLCRDGLKKIPVGIDLSVFPVVDSVIELRNHGRVSVLAMARPETPRRGFELLVASLAAVKKSSPDVDIVLFGSGNLASGDIPFECTLMGEVPQDALGAIYRASDIFVDTSGFQGFGLPPLEAMASGCACVLTDSGGISEYAVDGKNALIVGHTAGDVAGAIDTLIGNPALRRSLAVAGMDVVKAFDASRTAARWLELMARRPSAARGEAGARCVVIVPVFNQLHVVRRCIDSVLDHGLDEHELLIVDDGSDACTAAQLSAYAQRHANVFYLKNDENLGFVVSANRGMQWAADRGADIILLNSDTIVVDGWIDRLRQAAESAPDIGIVSPLSTHSPHLYLDVAPGSSFIEADRWLRERVDPVYPTIITPEGWCFYIRRDVYERLGGFDDVFGRGYCEESEYCMRVVAAGYRLVACDNLMIYHQGRATFGEQRSQRYTENRKIFDARWGPIYQRLYAQFHRADPLAGIRAAYKFECAGFNDTPDRDGALGDIVDVLTAPSMETDAVRFESLRTPVPDEVSPRSGRVVFVLPNLRPYGGIISVVMLVNAWILAGYDIKVAVLSRKGYDGDRLGMLTEPMFFESDEAFVNGCPEADMVIGTLWITMYFLVRLAVRRPSLRLGYFIQDFEADFPDVVERGLRPQVLRTYQWNVRAFAKTAWICDKVEACGGRVLRVPPSIDVDIFYPRDVRRPQNGRHVVAAMVRPSSAQRGVEVVLEVFKRIREADPNAELWTFGCTDDELRGVGASDLVDQHFGIVSQARVAEICSGADVFLDASHFHGFGRVIAEAMACGVACVITDSGGVSEFAIDGVNALMAKPGDAAGLADNVMRLFNDDDLRTRLAQNGRRAIEAFSPALSARRTAQIVLGLDTATPTSTSDAAETVGQLVQAGAHR